MNNISRENYQVEDFIAEESFIGYHFRSNKNDIQSWEEWLDNRPDKKKMAREAGRMLDSLSLTISEIEFNSEFEKIKEEIKNSKGPREARRLDVLSKLPALHKVRKSTIRYMLPLFLVLAAGIFWLFISSKRQAEKVTETVNTTSSPLTITLSDSTVVSLAPHSHLKYPLQFGDKQRDVFLVGNAQFNVKRNVHHPFKVHTENIIATVLGTVFNIKSSGDSAIEVELLKGKLNVAIMSSKMEIEQSVLLVPNEKAVYVRNEKHLYKDIIVARHEVTFHKSDFADIANQLKNVFGVTVINESKNKAWRFNGSFKNATAKEIIENICLIKNLSPVEKGDTIFIK